MQNWRGLWLPAHEKHLTGWMDKVNKIVDGKPAYQYSKLELALAHVRQWRCAIDIGAHCGLWSMHLAKRFQLLHAFEPVALHRECFERNVVGTNEFGGNVILHAAAVGAEAGSVTIHTTDGSSGDSWVDPAIQGGATRLIRLDDMEIGPIDFMKLDTEGFELPALRGARGHIERDRPCIIVEQKPGRAQKHGLTERGAVEYLQSLGAVLRKEISGDFIFSWPD